MRQFHDFAHRHAIPFMDHNRFDADASAQMECLLQDLARMYRERNQALQEVTEAHHEALFRLALAAEFRDDDTGAHIVRMGYLAEALALAAGAPPAWAAMLRMAAPMHDVGKIGIPDAVLKKPGGLSQPERAVMDGHASIGAEIMGRSRIPLFQLAAQVALTHHERWDGSGYPRGLAGADIPLAGRIVAVVDVFDALTMDRCYRKALGDEQALALMLGGCGTAFDPDLVDHFVRALPRMLELRDAVNGSSAGFADLIRGPGSLGRAAAAASAVMLAAAPAEPVPA